MAPTSAPYLDVEGTLAKLSLSDKIKLLAGQGFWQTASINHPRPKKSSTPANRGAEQEVPSVPPITFSDGPNGVRGKFFNGFLSSCFPCSSGLGSSFDKDLATEVGEALGKECRARGVHVLLGPTINTQRSPLGGRSYESYSEDPHLNGTIAAEYIKALQAKGVSACVKHFVANDQEFERFSMSSEVSERALREIYLKPFQIAIRDAQPWSLMTSYNPVNGVHTSENTWLLDDILRKEWGWDGLVISDWTGTYSTVRAIKAGLDLEMPGPAVQRGPAIGRALATHKLDISDIDACVRRVLTAVQRGQKSGIPFDSIFRTRIREKLVSIWHQLRESGEVYETITDPFCTPHELLRKAAADMVVLLKNQPKGVGLSSTKLLPLGPETKKIAVIGPNAADAVICGGGSATLRPTYMVSPLDGIRDAIQANAARFQGTEVKYTIGVNDTSRQLSAIDPYLTPPVKPAPSIKNVPKGKPIQEVISTVEHLSKIGSAELSTRRNMIGSGGPSNMIGGTKPLNMIGRTSTGTRDLALFESWDEEPTDDWMAQSPNFMKTTPEATYSTNSYTAACFFLDEDEEAFPQHNWSKFTTIFTPDADGKWTIDLFFVFATGNLFINKELAIDLSTDPQLGSEFFGMGTRIEKVTRTFKKDQEYLFELRMCSKDFVSKVPSVASRGGLKLGVSKKPNDVEFEIQEAVKLAKWADVAVLVVGLNEDWESEGFDRTNLRLPGSTDKLIESVIAANPHTVIVNQSGAPVAMPWLDKLEHGALLQAFYGGNETGNGIADILFGTTNPSAKLSLTFPKRLQDNPSYPSYGSRTQDKDKVLYNEGIFVGYRGYEIKDVKPLFPFGFGLSYTTFEYSNLDVSKISPDGSFTVKFTIKNTGTVFGREVAQVYVSDTESSLPRPKKELHGFTKVPLNAGQSKTVSVSLDKYALSFFDEKAGHWVAEAGEFGIAVGGSSDDLPLTQSITLGQGFTWSGL